VHFKSTLFRTFKIYFIFERVFNLCFLFYKSLNGVLKLLWRFRLYLSEKTILTYCIFVLNVQDNWVQLNLTAWESRATEWNPVWWKEIVSIKFCRKAWSGTWPVAVVDGCLVSKPGAPPAVCTRRHDHTVTERQKDIVHANLWLISVLSHFIWTQLNCTGLWNEVKWD